MNKKFISWRRVSTFKQGRSGLGLEAQKEIIRYFIERDNGEWLADYEECYTGKELSGCSELHKAMEHAKRENAVLIIAKSDRFRNTAEALKIYEEMGDGRIMFCDLPTSDKFSLTLFFALAEREALLVSIRTKQALAAKKKRGEALGGASDAWKKSFNRKSKEERKESDMKRGAMKNERYMQKREVQVFLKVLKNVFPEACEGEDPCSWEWGSISTRREYKDKIFALMKDYKELDEDLFRKWDLSGDACDRRMHMKLCSHIETIREAVKTYGKNRNNN